MPELPEVEVIRRGLEQHVTGRRIVAAAFQGSRVARRYLPGPDVLATQLTGRDVLAARRRGKYLWLVVDRPDEDPMALTVHLGMSGQLLVVPPDAPALRHTHAVLSLTPSESDTGGSGQDAWGLVERATGGPLLDGRRPDGRRPDGGRPDGPNLDGTRSAGGRPAADVPVTQLRFVDQRTFGGMALVPLVPDRHSVDPQLGSPSRAPQNPTGTDGPAAACVPSTVAHIAPDPFDAVFDRAGVIRRMKTRASGVKRALLDQTLVSGIGNIYADEALWRAGVHGERRCSDLTRPALGRILDHAAAVMSEALTQGGTSFDALYVNVNGASGYFDRKLRAYGREGLPCDRCGRPIRREHFMNRSSYSCPRCQPRPR